jgi:hypothetical protein
MTIRTKERLAQVLHAAGLFDMEKLARSGCYDDFESESATPCIDLVLALETYGRKGLADRARNGEWDATSDEGEHWHGREGRHLFGARHS